MKLFTLCLISALLILSSCENFMKPLTQDNISFKYLKDPFETTWNYNTNSNLVNSDQFTYNSNGDFAVIVSANGDDYNARIAFYNSKGEQINQFKLENLIQNYSNYGINGVSITSSGEDDSVFVVFTAQNTSVSSSSILGGILGVNGSWKRGGALVLLNDTRIGGQQSSGSEVNRLYPKAIKSGKYVYVMAETQLYSSSNYLNYYVAVDLSGTGNLTINDTIGTAVSFNQNTPVYSYTSNFKDCIDMDSQGLAICTMFTRETINSSYVYTIKLIKFNAGSVSSVHDVTYDSQEKADKFTQPRYQNLNRIPGTTKFVLSYSENQGQGENQMIRQYDTSDLNDPVVENIYALYGSGQASSGALNQLQMTIISETLGYLTYYVDEITSENNYILQFNPTTCEIVGFPIKINESYEYFDYVKINFIDDNGQFKLSLLLFDGNNNSVALRLVDLDNQNFCDEVDSKKWVCLLCSEGYHLNYDSYCILGDDGDRKSYQDNNQSYYPSIPYEDPNMQFLYEDSSVQIIGFNLAALIILMIFNLI